MNRNIVILLFAVLLYSCSDYLAEENKTRYSTEYVYNSTEGLNLALTSVYSMHRSYAGESECVTMFANERGTDLVTTCGGTGNFYGIYDPNYLKPSASQIKFRWTLMYKIIARCNEIIDASKNLEESEELDKIVAEAYCFRAQSYFLLFQTYDRIWLNTKAVTAENVNEPRDYRPATSNEVFDLLYSDLNYAIEHLQWHSEPGRFNQAAARHMLAKVALWKKDWQTALDQVKAIDESHEYELLPNVADVFNAADLNHNEALLTEQWSENVGGNLSTTTPKGHKMASLFIAQYRTVLGGSSEVACSEENGGFTYGRLLVSPYLLSLYDTEKDKRYKDWYILKYKNTRDVDVTYNSQVVHPGEYLPKHSGGSGDPRYSIPGCLKWSDKWTRTAWQPEGFKDIIIYRLADTYIAGAEAAFRLGDKTLARYYYNKTWMRAGNPEFTGDVSLKNIIDEEAREMAFENDRWFFLKRLGILIDQVSKYAGDPVYPASLKGRTNLPANPHFVRWPIPASEIINMGEENFPQNVGYN